MSRRGYVALLAEIFARGEGGVLELRKQRNLRRLHILAGSPVWYETGLGPEDLGDALVATGTIEAARMIELRARLPAGREIRQAILDAGLCTEDEIVDRVRSYVERGVASVLSWDDGEWSFEATQSLPVQLLQWAAFGLGDPLRMLWPGVRTHISVEEALASVQLPEAGPLIPTAAMSQRFDGLELEDTYATIPAVLGRGAALDDVFRRVADRSGNLPKVLWMLVSGGLLTRERGGRPLDWAGAPAAERRDPGGVETAQRGHRMAEPPAVAPPVAQLTPPGERLPATDPMGRTPAQVGSAETMPRAQAVPVPPISVPRAAPASAPTMRPVTGARPMPLAHEGLPPTPPRPVSPSQPSLSPPLAPPPSDARMGRSGTHPGTRIRGQLPEHGHRVREAFKQRANQDYYSFLGLSTLASRREIEDACNRLGAVWKQGEEDATLPDELRDQARELLAETTIVWRTMGDEARRREYDRRLAAGTAPKLQAIRGARPMTNPQLGPARAGTLPPDPGAVDITHAQARRAMDAGDWTQAWPILQKCRLDNPSSAEVMADLGWTAWHVRGRSGDAGESAEDYLRLALTFEPRHLRALEYLARIGLRRGEPEVARKRLQQYLSVQPDAAWARRALAALDEPENTVNSPGSKLRLRKG